jgi:hypothetical protein
VLTHYGMAPAPQASDCVTIKKPAYILNKGFGIDFGRQLQAIFGFTRGGSVPGVDGDELRRIQFINHHNLNCHHHAEPSDHRAFGR